MTPGATTRFPIVLVGGLLVWGREERFGFRYWGGRKDLQVHLNQEGYRFLTAAPGPCSSNWDRACELFAMLKGGCVDYGEAHAKRHGHARFGLSYPGLYPHWDAQNPAHVVGHSMGGQTLRVLAHLLDQGSEEERSITPPSELSPLFQGNHPWLASLCTLATPHHGTTLAWKRDSYVETIHRGFALATHFGMTGWRRVLDLKMGHWGLQKLPGESRMAFFRRVSQHPLWKGTQDLAAFELSPAGAARLNQHLMTPPWLRCFSWSFAKTLPDAKGHHKPQPGMLALWRLNAKYMGQTLALAGKSPLEECWRENDGVVNTCSMAGPTGEVRLVNIDVRPFFAGPRSGGPSGVEVPSAKDFMPGCWHHMGVLKNWDHTEILGLSKDHKQEWMEFYRHWAAFVAELE